MPHLQETQQSWWKTPPKTLERSLEILNDRIEHLNDQTDEGKALRKLYNRAKQESENISRKARESNPIAFVCVSWEQALKLNSWVWGVSYIIDFDANRKGKTAGTIFNSLLWMLPNNPDWILFKEYTDEWDRLAIVLPRPAFRHVRRLQTWLEAHPEVRGDPKFQPYDVESGNAEKFAILQNECPECFVPAYPKPPMTNTQMTMWHGAPDADYHKNIIMPEWLKWAPNNVVERPSVYDKTIDFKIPYETDAGEDFVNWHIIFKSYESKDEKFSGAAVDAILLTEGVKQAHLNEIKQRFKEDAFAAWDYTPYEARNTGSKTAIAHKVFQGKEQMPLCPYIFSGFGIEKTPNFILPESKKNDLIRMWGGKAEGKARISGQFYTSSPVVLSNLDLKFHTVPWSVEELFDRHPECRLYRGLDPGYDHPTACAWGALTKSNTWFIYRMLSQSGLSLGQRCKKIIEMSNNTRQKVPFGLGEEDFYYEEIHENTNSEIITMTLADYHTFKADERTKQSYANNYTREGLLLVPSITMGPKERGQQFDLKLEPDLLRPHPILRIPPGAKVYFLINETGVAEACEMLENIFWARYGTGERRGEPKDEMQDHGDDEFDAISYLVCSPYRWSRDKPVRKIARETERIGSNTTVSSRSHSSHRPAFSITGY